MYYERKNLKINITNKNVKYKNNKRKVLLIYAINISIIQSICKLRM
jgi:hypothetical protein